MFLNNRHQDPTTGTFLSVDPLIAKTGEAYIYAGGNPVKYSDPNWLEKGANGEAQAYCRMTRGYGGSCQPNQWGLFDDSGWLSAYWKSGGRPYDPYFDLGGFLKGMTWGFVKGTATGIGKMFAHPIESLKNLRHRVTNPIDTLSETVKECTGTAQGAGSCATGLALGGGWFKRLFGKRRKDMDVATEAVDDIAAAASRPAGVGDDFVSQVANNRKGTVWRAPGTTGNAGTIRIMEPTAQYPNGYVRFYNNSGQSLGLNGKLGPNSATHIPINPDGTYPLPKDWGAG